ncbi:hypothetical protein ROZALSC1DRAFT_31415, partial [Rozella allomycis CSF55]
KTFYDSAISILLPFLQANKQFAPFIDGVVLTHPHADACFGLDELRQWTMVLQENAAVYCDQQTFSTIAQAFPYLVNKECATGGGDVSDISFRMIEWNKTFEVCGVDVLPLPGTHLAWVKVVEHGIKNETEPFMCLSFHFKGISYISDVSKISEQGLGEMKGTTKVLILDMLKGDSNSYHKSHFTFDQCIQVIETIKPEVTFLVGMSHSTEHDKMTKKLELYENETGHYVRLAFDGLYLQFDDDIVHPFDPSINLHENKM